MGWLAKYENPALKTLRVFRVRGFEKMLVLYRPPRMRWRFSGSCTGRRTGGATVRRPGKIRFSRGPQYAIYYPFTMSWLQNILSDPRKELMRAIVTSASSCTQDVMSRDPQAPPAKALGVLWEFTACFLHVTSRISARRHGQTMATSKALNDVGGRVAVALTETYSAELSEEERQQAVSQFCRYLSLAEAEYCDCKEIIVKGEVASTASVFGLLGHRIMLHMGKNDISYVLHIEDLAFRTIITEQFRSLVDKAIGQS